MRVASFVGAVVLIGAAGMSAVSGESLQRLRLEPYRGASVPASAARARAPAARITRGASSAASMRRLAAAEASAPASAAASARRPGG